MSNPLKFKAEADSPDTITPRPLIKTIVKVVAPKIGDKIYDGAVGSAGFLVEAFEYLKETKDLSTKEMERLQEKTFDLSVKNPNKGGEVVLREPKEILEEMRGLDKESEEILSNIKRSL